MSSAKRTTYTDVRKWCQRAFYGKEADGRHCIDCGRLVDPDKDLRDALSKKEWGISALCQACQDAIFGGK